MSPKVELGLTIAVFVLGFAYFGWRWHGAEGDEDLVYIGLIIIGAIVAQRAIKDVIAKIKAPRDGGV